MNQNSLLKVSCAIGFLAFAAVSCWATAESLHLLLAPWPLFMCWVVTVGFFFIASWGTKMIVDSLNQKIYLEKRGLRLIGGILILLFFWLVCSMPTNTHTFFFRSVINDKITSDITTTNGYLVQIRDNVTTESKIKQRQTELQNKVETKLGELKAEILNPVNKGYGPNAKRIFKDFAELLGVASIEPLSYKGTSQQDLEKLYDANRQKIYQLMENKMMNIRQEMTPSSNTHQQLAGNNIKNLNLIKKHIDDDILDVNDAEDVEKICEKLNEGYSTIRNYKQFVTFKDETDEKAYTAPNAVTKVKRMISVFDVWTDFVKGEYAGHGFIFWVIISILVDIAAFIFFDIAFKKSEY